ncbi:MAG: magnesium transporter CorA family protein [Dehalococcoidia bacterium]
MSDPGALLTRAYRGGALAAEGFPLTDISSYLGSPGTSVWVDLLDPGHAEMRSLAEGLGLHELAVEDALARSQRPKLDHYSTHQFFSCQAVRLDRTTNELQRTEVDAFIGDRWLVTVRKGGTFPLDRLIERLDRSPDLLAHGVGFLVYSLLDVVVDGYFDAVEAFDEYYDEASESIFSETPFTPAQQRDWFEMRQALVRFHRTAFPMREAVSAFLRREHEVSPELYPYYQDVYDHILRVVESTEALRDLVTTIVETNLSLRDYRQNQIVKKVTSWAAIIAVPTLITGYFGMNVPFPGSGETSGVIASTALALLLSGALYILFRKNEWL